MSKDRNCGNAVPYPIYPQPMMMPMQGMPNQMYQYNGMIPYQNMQSNTYDQQVNSLSNQISNLERRVSNLESMVGNTNYNNSNYQMM